MTDPGTALQLATALVAVLALGTAIAAYHAATRKDQP
jgi:hypothetical protein